MVDLNRELAMYDWMEDHGYDPIGASDMIGDAMKYARQHPEIPVEEVRDAWWASETGERRYYPSRFSE
jgi:hypothetical protein